MAGDIRVIKKGEPVKPEYMGFKDVQIDPEALARLYEGGLNAGDNKFDCVENEYVILRDEDGNPLDHLRYENGVYRRVKPKSINSDWSKIKPRNCEQILAIDMLLSEHTTVHVLSGRAGSGKSMLAVAFAMEAIKKGKFEKLVYIRNNISVRDTQDIGAIPGGVNEKLLPFMGPLIDHANPYMIGDCVEVIHLGHIRGRDIRNSLIFCTEAENLTTAHASLLISRVGEGSKIIFDGDTKQIDRKTFEIDNGLRSTIDVLKGNKLFSCVKLRKSERSPTAALADLFDR